MFPWLLRVAHFLGEKPTSFAHSFSVESCKKRFSGPPPFGMENVGPQVKADNIYIYTSDSAILTTKDREVLEKDFTGKIFVCQDSAYKIDQVDVLWFDLQQDNTTRVIMYFVINTYTDTRVQTLLNKLTKIKQNLEVCADSVEEHGGLHVAEGLRNQAKRLLLEDLI